MIEKRTKRFFWVLAILIVAAVVFFSFKSSLISQGENKSEVLAGGSSASVYLVNITSLGFSPREIRINSGEGIEWINSGDAEAWPASDVHPEHSAYPGSGINKCGTEEQYSVFDACRGLKNGENYRFYFNERGTWEYHNHLNPEMKGRVIVG